MLTLQPYMYSFDGGDLNQNRRPFAFEVIGMPEGREARIAEFRHRWKVLHTTNGVSDTWSGKYRSKEEALAAVETERRAA